jgi:hypothetical protein
MYRRFRGLLAALPAALLVSAMLLPGSALAHERRTMGGGKYNVLVGWDVEPAFQSLKNAASIRITLADAGDPPPPVEGAEKTLRVQIRQGDDVREFPLRTVFGQKGYYVADVVPTRAGDYQWTFVGSINGDQINEKFDTADGKFNGIEPLASLQFPVAAGDPTQVARAAMVGDVISAVWVLDNSGLHDVDDALDSGKDLPAGALGRVQHAQLVAGATAWPSTLQPTASDITRQLTQLRMALEAGDMTAAMTPAHEAHERGHDLSSQAYAWLAAQANLVAPGAANMATGTDAAAD